MSRPRLVTVGEAMIRLTPAGGHLVRDAASFDAYVGGCELNAAIAAAQVGIDATWVSALPPGSFADRITDHARRFGVSPVTSVVDGRVGLYVVELGPAPRGSDVHYDRAGAAFALHPTDALVTESLVSGADAVLGSGITLALGSEPRRAVRALFASSRTTRFFEINHRSKLWSVDEARDAVTDVLPSVDVLVASRYDLDTLLDLGEDPIDAAHCARDRWGIDRVVITERHGGIGEIGTNEVTVVGDDVEARASAQGMVVDPVGAGDAATGTFIGVWLRTGSVRAAAEASVVAAAGKQTIPGDALITAGTAMSSDGPRIRR